MAGRVYRTPGWGLYVTGRFPVGKMLKDDEWKNTELSDDLKFAELVAQTLGSLRQVQALQQRQCLDRAH